MLISDIVDFVRDLKRISDIPGTRAPSRSDTRQAYLRFRRLQRGPGVVSMYGYEVAYLDGSSMLQLFREIFVDRLYDALLLSSAPRIIDCGSNIGMSILFFKQMYPGARIMGFEPHPLVFRALSDNVGRNALKDVVLHQVALGESKGTIEFFANESEPGALNMSVFQGKGQTAITVPVDLLSGHIDEEVDLLKLDVEGAEEMVLQDLANRGKLQIVKNIVCEYHHHRDRNVDRLSHTLRILEQAGFGYHIGAYLLPYPDRPRYQQNVIIHAYRKSEC